MANELTPILQAAKDILQDAGRKGLHITEIAERAVSQNKNMGMAADDFCKKLGQALAANLKLKTSKPTFAKVNHDKGPRKGKPKMGWYRLRMDKAVPAQAQIQTPKAERSFLGCAGEHAVMSELLFWGYNASTMAVDDGVDIVAGKDGKFFYIQVKTASCQEGNKYQFTISHSAFQRYDTYNVFYVLVLRKDQHNDFIILPAGSINHYLNSGVVGRGASLSLGITHDERKTKFILNGKENVTPFYGNFGATIK
ncbi:hypothetical protein LJC46_04250 [Desulfovibrio sp. OttesenSCG-928-G15]|nr:hypothetical protein [Desulfovibrio sp. OttesenSCG-928-G15]